MRVRRLALAGAAVIGLGSYFAYAAGMFSTLPVIGGSSYCASIIGSGPTQLGPTGTGAGTTVTGAPSTFCGQTVPAGPTTPTGLETVPADTNIASGAGQPQTALMPTSMFGGGPYNGTNRVIGGDFATNLWQRGNTPINSFVVSSNNALIGPDRFAFWAASSGVSLVVSKQTGSSDVIPSQGLQASMRIGRSVTPSAGANVNQICTFQVLDSRQAAPLLGNNAILSFWALAGAAFSPTNSNITATIAYYTAADAIAGGTNTTAYATAIGTVAGASTTAIAGYTAATAGPSAGTTGSTASGVVTIPISTTWTRYAVWAPIPSATAAGTTVTGVGFHICFTPTGSAAATDYMELAGVQLEAGPSNSAASGPLANGVTSPKGFERRAMAAEQLLMYYYTFVLTEPATNAVVAQGGVMSQTSGSSPTGTACEVTYAFPTAMRVAPTLSNLLASGTFSVSSWTIKASSSGAPSNFVTTAIATSPTINTPNQASFAVTSGTAVSSGTVCQLMGPASFQNFGVGTSSGVVSGYDQIVWQAEP